MTQKMIEKLVAMGASRWTKGTNDRLYIKNAAAALIGFEFDSYKSSGMVSSAKINGEKISNTQAAKLIAVLDRAYIDVTAGTLVMGDSAYKADVLEAIRALAVEEVEETTEEATEEVEMIERDCNEALNIASWKTVGKNGVAHYWFSDNVGIYETDHLIDVWAVEWDENRAWIEDGVAVA